MDDKLAVSALSSRYASKEMSYLFSPYHRTLNWRKLWLFLAKAQKKLGLPITDEQIQELQANLDKIDLKKVAEYEKQLRHDVMAHIYAYGDLCPHAKSILHLGATSCFVTDNADVLIFKEALELIGKKLSLVIRQLADFAIRYKKVACLGYTHFQNAQPTTVGKRASLWLQDFLMDAEDLEEVQKKLKLLGVKGATGTQAAFLSLFEADEEKVEKLEEYVAKEIGIEKVFIIAGQTYTRKQDVRVIKALSSFAASAHKMATDIRLLAHLRELQEVFGEKQVGSSAMPYKRNPVLSERLCGIARYLISLEENPSYTAATQWLERSIDDSSNRRIVFPQAFLAADALLNILIKLTANLGVNCEVIHRNLMHELPFFATENILMKAVQKGGNRQALHEKLRKYSLEAMDLRNAGKEHHLLTTIEEDKDFALSKEEIFEQLETHHYIGRAEAQVSDFIKFEVFPYLSTHVPYEGPITFADL